MHAKTSNRTHQTEQLVRLQMQNKYLEQYDDLYGEDMHLVKMPLLSHEIRGKKLLLQYGELLLKPYEPEGGPSIDPFERIEELEAELARLKGGQ